MREGVKGNVLSQKNILPPSKKDVGEVSKFRCICTLKKWIDTSKFRQTCDLILWTEVVVHI